MHPGPVIGIGRLVRPDDPLWPALALRRRFDSSSTRQAAVFSTAPRQGKPCGLDPAGRTTARTGPIRGSAEWCFLATHADGHTLRVRCCAGGGGLVPVARRSRLGSLLGLGLPLAGPARQDSFLPESGGVAPGSDRRGDPGCRRDGSPPRRSAARRGLSYASDQGRQPVASSPGGPVGSAEDPAPVASRRRAGEPHAPGHPGR